MRGVKRRLRAAARRVPCATPGSVRLASLARHRARRSSLALPHRHRLHAASSTRARFLLQTVLPPEASLDEVDRLNHRVEDVLRDVSRGRGRRAPHRPRRAHRGSDAAHRVGRAGGARSRSGRRSLDELRGRDARARSRTCRASRCCSRRRSACASTRASAARPADLSVRIFGPDLDELVAPRRAGARRR